MNVYQGTNGTPIQTFSLSNATPVEYALADGDNDVTLVTDTNTGIVLTGSGLGVDTGGPFAPDAAWDASWQVNVMAHVLAARVLLPGMLERGQGYLLQTVSAAGLLTEEEFETKKADLLKNF